MKMSMTVKVLVLLIGSSFETSIMRQCIPGTTFELDEIICVCDNLGQWNDANCIAATRNEQCESGKVVWQGCSQCICQENGLLSCTNTGCSDNSSTPSILRKDLLEISTWCSPFQMFYVNCSICICPASARTAEAKCVIDNYCKENGLQTSPGLIRFKIVCIPNVMYLFPCLRCLCSKDGYIALDQCAETCNNPHQIEFPRRCITRTFYRKNCNVCWCPEDGMLHDKYCTKRICDKKSKYHKLIKNLTKRINKCKPNSFTAPKCFYCSCNNDGYINEDACFDLQCLHIDNFKYDIAKETCSPGEMVPVCVECLCLSNGKTNISYCTKECSYDSKLNVLRQILIDDPEHLSINTDVIKGTENKFCETDSIYFDQGKYCICPKNHVTNENLCTSLPTDLDLHAPVAQILKENITAKTLLRSACEPHTFVEIECNTCYCSKHGTIDPNWCSNDDCESKKIIQDNNEAATTVNAISDRCNSGSISKEGCNFCICPNSGALSERVCTKNVCSEIETPVNVSVSCEPLAYYLVDCNICVCPIDGLKNVDKCTKNLCEKSYLRASNCVPGELFSEDCKVCVCPPNGDKNDKVCTSSSCDVTEAPWKKIFKSENLSTDNTKETNRKLEVCFPGEEFMVGCKACVCPDIGLRAYALCTPMLCNVNDNDNDNKEKRHKEHDVDGLDHEQDSNSSRRQCITYNITDSSERKQCTPGSMYIIRCRQCICPYMGNINNFCRPLPEGTYCEQAFPNYNFVPMGRRIDEKNITKSNSTTVIPLNHNHTRHRCLKPGKIMNECFICQCEDDRTVVEEHCFRSDDKACKDAKPNFLKNFDLYR